MIEINIEQHYFLEFHIESLLELLKIITRDESYIYTLECE
jgi:hypothetical protein